MHSCDTHFRHHDKDPSCNSLSRLLLGGVFGNNGDSGVVVILNSFELEDVIDYASRNNLDVIVNLFDADDCACGKARIKTINR